MDVTPVTPETAAQLSVNWDALRMIMRNEVTMYRDLACEAQDEGMITARLRFDAIAEHAQRVIDAMDHLEAADTASVA